MNRSARAWSFVALAALITGALEWTPVAAQSPAPAAPQTPPPSAASLTPEAIYLRATHAMKEAPQPAYVTFDESVTARNMRLACTSDGTSLSLKHGDASGSYRVWFRTRDENAVSQDTATQKRCSGALLFPTGADVASLGPHPSVAPSAAPTDGSGGPPLIAAVRVESARYYRIELVGRESLKDIRSIGLRCSAYRDPATHPLTGMLVDEDSFLVRR